MTTDNRVFVIMMFMTEGPVFTPDGTPSIAGPVDVAAMLTAVPSGNGGELIAAYRDPDRDPANIADKLIEAAAQFRLPPGSGTAETEGQGR